MNHSFFGGGGGAPDSLLTMVILKRREWNIENIMDRVSEQRGCFKDINSVISDLIPDLGKPVNELAIL